MSQTSKCTDCSKPHRASGSRCLSCLTALRRRRHAAESRHWIVGVAGGGWWVWNARGVVLGQGDNLGQALAQAEEALEAGAVEALPPAEKPAAVSERTAPAAAAQLALFGDA